jgi:helix-turn-helix protein
MNNRQLVHKPQPQKKIKNVHVTTLWVSEVSEITEEQYSAISQRFNNNKEKEL